MHKIELVKDFIVYKDQSLTTLLNIFSNYPQPDIIIPGKHKLSVNIEVKSFDEGVSFEEWIKGFESRYSEEDLKIMKLSYELGRKQFELYKAVNEVKALLKTDEQRFLKTWSFEIGYLNSRKGK